MVHLFLSRNIENGNARTGAAAGRLPFFRELAGAGEMRKNWACLPAHSPIHPSIRPPSSTTPPRLFLPGSCRGACSQLASVMVHHLRGAPILIRGWRSLAAPQEAWAEYRPLRGHSSLCDLACPFADDCDSGPS
jgi:hypothetical protein